MKSPTFILICTMTICMTSCQLLVHKKCTEQTLTEDLNIMERRMDSTDFYNLKNGLCQIKLEGGDLNKYTYYKIKEFWSHNKTFRRHDVQISIRSMNESIQLADKLGCKNWKSAMKEQIVPYAMRPWIQIFNRQHNLIVSSIELGMTNNAILENFALDSFVQSNAFTFIKTETLIKNLKEALNQKIDSLRSL